MKILFPGKEANWKHVFRKNCKLLLVVLQQSIQFQLEIASRKKCAELKTVLEKDWLKKTPEDLKDALSKNWVGMGLCFCIFATFNWFSWGFIHAKQKNWVNGGLPAVEFMSAVHVLAYLLVLLQF